MKQKDKQSSEARLESTCDHPNDDIENCEQDRHQKHEMTAAIECLKKREIGGQQGNKSRRYQRS